MAILVGLEAAEVTRAVGEPVLPEAMSALHRAVQTSRLELAVEVGGEQVAVSPDGRWVVTTTVLRLGGGGSRVRDATTGEELARLVGPEEVQPWDVAVSPDGAIGGG